MSSLSSMSLRSFVEGDLTLLDDLLASKHEDLVNASLALSQPLTITKESAKRVLTKHLNGEFGKSAIQQWASFVRRGYFGGRKMPPIKPVEIGYDPLNEELLANLISRLDDIGDLIDGDLTTRDVEEIITSLDS